MTKELEKRLEEDFPFMEKGKSLKEQEEAGRINDIYSAFGLECRDGWFDLIYGLCSEIMQAYKEEKREIDLDVVQIKEKFGALRFYYAFKGKSKTIHGFDFISDNGVGGVRITPKGDGFGETISSIVRKYEKKSRHICEVCGNPGELRTDLRWILTLCDDCYSKRTQERLGCTNK